MHAIRKRFSKKSGQSAVEYLLVLVVVVGATMVFQNVLLPRLKELLVGQKALVEDRAMNGNPTPGSAAKVESFYRIPGKQVEVR